MIPVTRKIKCRGKKREHLGERTSVKSVSYTIEVTYSNQESCSPGKYDLENLI